MTKAEMVKRLKNEAELETYGEAERILNSVMQMVSDTLVNEKSLTLNGFGTFKVVQRKAHKGRNPRTGQTITIAARKAVKFTSAKALKEKVQ
ncbi:HU family DNA-binding protein [Desulfovibrio sp. OttesenSCG-928-I05]|nr:HU family DNA-binding protein [Desulfovibrio sp. OttesenSCG-928-I05]